MPLFLVTQFFPIMELAREFKVPVLFHTGHSPFSLPWQIGEVAEFFARFLMGHMRHGHGCYIHGTIITAMKYPNLNLETSGMVVDLKIEEAIGQLNQGRVMYGFDGPFHHHYVEMQKVKGSGLDENGLRNVFYNNAAKLLGIE